MNKVPRFARSISGRARLALVVFVVAVQEAASFDIPEKNSPELAWWRDSMKTHDERIGWWREARFGMFMHWGVYSALGNEYKGRKGGGYAEHIQRVLKVPIPEYRAKVAGIFNPTNFNADEWIRTAKEAGMGYYVHRGWIEVGREAGVSAGGRPAWRAESLTREST